MADGHIGQERVRTTEYYCADYCRHPRSVKAKRCERHHVISHVKVLQMNVCCATTLSSSLLCHATDAEGQRAQANGTPTFRETCISCTVA